jgi:hypothetical protein
MVPRPLVLSIPPVKNPPGSDQLLHRVWTQFDEDQRQTFIPNPHFRVRFSDTKGVSADFIPRL